ncbi:response regulator [Candidatus Auribacterota bacterium]
MIEHQILIADSDTKNAEQLKRELILKGFKVFLATDTQEALHLVKTIDIHLVLLSIDFQDRYSSSVLVEKIKSHNYLLPILLFINNFSDEGLSDFFDAGICDYLKKPFKLDALIKQIRKHVISDSDSLRKRTAVRQQGDIELTIDLPERKKTMKVRTVDIGQGGTFVKINKDLDANLNIGDQIKVSINLAEKQSEPIEAEVLWKRHTFKDGLPPGVGIKFISTPKAVRKFIEIYIMDHKIKAFFP